MRPLVRLAPVGLFVVSSLVDCKSLPTITPGTCGNGVVDPATEDCDTFPVGQCNPPGSADQCRLDCTPATGHTCPAGWGCGVDNICREPSGQFVQVGDAIPAGAWRVLTGDLDGDGRQDVVARTQPGGDLASRLRAHFFDDGANLAQQVVIPPALGLPLVGDIDGDGTADLAFTLVRSVQQNTTGTGVLLGQPDRSFAPISYPTLQNPGSFSRVGLFGEGQDGLIAVLAEGPNGIGVVLGQVEGGNIDLQNTLLFAGKDTTDQFANVEVARFDEDPTSCGSIAFAFPRDPYAYVVPVCVVDGTQQVWNPAIAKLDPSAFQVPLPAGQTVPVIVVDSVSRVLVPSGVHVADVNGDRHLDLLIASTPVGKPLESIAFVAYGDGHGNFSPATQLGISIPAERSGALPYLTPGCGPQPDPTHVCMTFPLAAGDFTGDGMADFVTPNYVLGSTTAGGVDGGAGTTEFFPLETNLSRFWSEAVIHDVNGDGNPDIAIATDGEVDVDFFSGTGSIDLNPFTIVTDGTPHQFATGDFDGDFIDDLAFAENTGTVDEIAIAYGQPFTSPADPQAIASLPKVTQAVATTVPLTEVQTLVVVGQLDSSTNAVLLLPGSGDRLPLAVLPLLTYLDPAVACTTNPASSAAPSCSTTSPGTSCVGGGCGTTGTPLGLATGRFRSTPAGATVPYVDEVAMTVNLSGSLPDYRLWANLATQDPSFDTPAYSQELSGLGWSIDFGQSAVLMGTATLDSSGLDSLVVVTTGDTRGAVATTSTLRVVTLPASLTNQPKQNPPDNGWAPNVTFSTDLPVRVNQSAQLRLFDGNGDGAVDIFVLPRFEAQRGELQVAWNHQGSFDAGDVTSIKFPGVPADGPYDFAPVQDAPGAPLAIAIVSTQLGVAVAHLDPASHAVTSVTTVDATRRAIGVAAADVNGDGVQDLVVGDTVGNLYVYRGKPVLP